MKAMRFIAVLAVGAASGADVESERNDYIAALAAEGLDSSYLEGSLREWERHVLATSPAQVGTTGKTLEPVLDAFWDAWGGVENSSECKSVQCFINRSNETCKSTRAMAEAAKKADYVDKVAFARLADKVISNCDENVTLLHMNDIDRSIGHQEHVIRGLGEIRNILEAALLQERAALEAERDALVEGKSKDGS